MGARQGAGSTSPECVQHGRHEGLIVPNHGSQVRMSDKIGGIMKRLRPRVGDIIWSNLNTMIIAGSALVMSIVFVRSGAKDLYGHYLFVTAMVGLFSVVSISGTKSVVFRTAAQGHDGVYREATKLSFLWSLGGGVLLAAAGGLLWMFGRNVSGCNLLIAALFFPFVTSLENWMLLMKGRSDFSKLMWMNLTKLVIGLAAISAAIVLTRSIIVILLAYFAVQSAFNIVYHMGCLRLLKNDLVDASWKKQSFALTITELSSIAFGRVDILLVAALLPMESVAVYGLVMRLTGVFLALTKSTTEAVLPGIFKSDKITIRFFYKSVAASFVVPIMLSFVVKYPIVFMYGPESSEWAPYVRLYLFSIPLYYLYLLVSYFMIKHKLNREINYNSIIGIIGVVILYVVLIPRYGIWGGVIASILFFVVATLSGLLLLSYSNKIIDLSHEEHESLGYTTLRHEV